MSWIVLTLRPEVVLINNDFLVVGTQVFLCQGEGCDESDFMTSFHQFPDNGIGHHEVTSAGKEEGGQDARSFAQIELLESHKAHKKYLKGAP